MVNEARKDIYHLAHLIPTIGKELKSNDKKGKCIIIWHLPSSKTLRSIPNEKI